MSHGRTGRLGIEQLSVFGLPPVDFISLAAGEAMPGATGEAQLTRLG